MVHIFRTPQGRYRVDEPEIARLPDRRERSAVHPLDFHFRSRGREKFDFEQEGSLF